MDYSTFLSIFPEFTNLAEYPITRVNFWLSVAVNFVNTQRWRSLTNQGIALYTAHMLKLAELNGEVEGLLTSNSVDGVNYSQDVASLTIIGANHYNKTTYGIQYFQLSRMVGAGGMSLSGGYPIGNWV